MKKESEAPCLCVRVVLTGWVWFFDVRLQGISHALTLPTVLDWKMRKHAMILSRADCTLKCPHTLSHTPKEMPASTCTHTHINGSRYYFLKNLQERNSFTIWCRKNQIKVISTIYFHWRIVDSEATSYFISKILSSTYREKCHDREKK